MSESNTKHIREGNNLAWLKAISGDKKAPVIKPDDDKQKNQKGNK